MSAASLSLSTTAATYQEQRSNQSWIRQSSVGPVAVVHKTVVERNCRYMLDAINALRDRYNFAVEWRAHVKTHKTVEIAKLQAGRNGQIRLVVSTIQELVFLFPWLQKCVEVDREVDVVYGLPPSEAAILELCSLLTRLPIEHRSIFRIGFLIDHSAQLKLLQQVSSACIRKDPTFARGGTSLFNVYFKLDIGYARAGVPITGHQERLRGLLEAVPLYRKFISRDDRDGNQDISFMDGRVFEIVGVYTHAGDSYASSTAEDAVGHLGREIEGCLAVLDTINKQKYTLPRGLIFSLGATPSATSVSQLFARPVDDKELRANKLMRAIPQNVTLELHAGVYPFLDLQQLATRATPTTLTQVRPSSLSAASGPPLPATTSDIGFAILAEVISLYPGRNGKDEALINAGSLALGREPCKEYSGYGCVAISYRRSDRRIQRYWRRKGLKARIRPWESGWIVSRVSQEHGILTWLGETSSALSKGKQHADSLEELDEYDRGQADGVLGASRSQLRAEFSEQLHDVAAEEELHHLKVGDKVVVWPNHACIAAAGFSEYVVVDSPLGQPGRKGFLDTNLDEIPGTRLRWQRCNGW